MDRPPPLAPPAPADSAALPPGLPVVLDPAVRRPPDGTYLLGGSPLRLLRLSEPARAILADWAAGMRRDDLPARTLGRRLSDAGLAHPRPRPGAPAAAEVTVVIPVRDRPAALRRCLAAVGPCARTLVVDDGSTDPAEVAGLAGAAGADVLRRPAAGGPAAARNDGLAAARTPYVAFVDSDCVPSPGWLETLLPHFADPAVGAVAPRITALSATSSTSATWIGSYETVCSALDLGPREGPVVPMSRLSYVPAAAILVRRTAVGAGFAADLAVGEDVDLVWRLHDAGWRVRYEPAGTVAHDHRTDLARWWARRRDYGTSAAPLARRHPGRLAPVVLSPWTAATWLLVLSGRPLAAVGVSAVAGVGLARRLPVPGAAPLAARLIVVGTAYAGRNLAAGMVRHWWPATLLLGARSRRVRLAAAAAVLPAVADYRRLRPPLDLPRFVAARALDDLGYGTGVWLGCWRHRTLAPLRPALRG